MCQQIIDNSLSREGGKNVYGREMRWLMENELIQQMI